MKRQIANAQALRDEATALREAGALDEAASKIREAANELDALWRLYGDAIDKAGADASPDEKDLVEELAETYGVMGGIHRSAGNFEAASLAYDEGVTYEQHPARKEDNSYDLVQRLLNRVLLKPALAGSLQWTVQTVKMGQVQTVEMGQELVRAEKVLADQTRGTRSTDPWAAADLVLIETLLTPLRPESEHIQRFSAAYAKLDSLNPKPFVFESTLRTFRDAERTLQAVEAPARHAGVDALAAALTAAIARLEEGFRQSRLRHSGA